MVSERFKNNQIVIKIIVLNILFSSLTWFGFLVEKDIYHFLLWDYSNLARISLCLWLLWYFADQCCGYAIKGLAQHYLWLSLGNLGTNILDYCGIVYNELVTLKLFLAGLILILFLARIRRYGY